MTERLASEHGLHIADSVVYGHLWATPEIRALFTDQGRTQAWLDILAALAEAQAAVGLVPPAAAVAIRAGAKVEALDLDAVAEQTRQTSHSTLGLIRCLTGVLPEHARQWVYYGATVQDLTDTWTALVMRDVSDIIERDVARLEAAALALAQRHRDTVMCGRTHAQPGLPVTFGFKAAVWASELGRHRTRLAQGRPRREVVQLGGALGTMEFWGAEALELLDAFAQRLGLAAPDVPWITARDGIAEFTAVLAMVASTVAKIGNEILHLQRQELGEVHEPWRHGVVGSITMPHKRNPEFSEQLDTLARLVRADAGLALDGMLQLHERDARSWKAEWAFLPQACTATATGLRLAIELLEGLEVDADRMAANLADRGGYILSEPVMRLLADRIGKHAAQAAVYEATMAGIDRGVGLREALLADPTVSAQLSGEEIDRCLDPATALGAAGAFVDRVLARAGGEDYL
jgi:adenylosuccinate lyase